MGVVSDKTTVIDGKTYTTKTFPAAEGLRLLPRIINLFGERILALFFKVDEDSAEQLLENPKVLAGMLVEMSQQAEDSEAGWLVLKDILKYTTCEQCQVGAVAGHGSVHTHFDTHFAGDYAHLLKVCFWAAQEGFSKP